VLLTKYQLGDKIKKKEREWPVAGMGEERVIHHIYFSCSVNVIKISFLNVRLSDIPDTHCCVNYEQQVGIIVIFSDIR
jgi:hypothetical protein